MQAGRELRSKARGRLKMVGPGCDIHRQESRGFTQSCRAVLSAILLQSLIGSFATGRRCRALTAPPEAGVWQHLGQHRAGGTGSPSSGRSD